MNYLKATKYDKRVMGYEDLFNLEIWVDALHAAHEDMRGAHRRVYILWSWYYPRQVIKTEVEHKKHHRIRSGCSQ